MKLLLTAILLIGLWTPTAEAKPKSKSPTFEVVAGEALKAMEKRAVELKITGAALVAFAEGDTVTGWSSRMVMVGRLHTEPKGKEPGYNLLAIAYAKAAEMATTLMNSGKSGRPAMTGENGWEGGLIKKTARGHVIVAFSGGPSEDDLKVSQTGLDVLAAKM